MEIENCLLLQYILLIRNIYTLQVMTDNVISKYSSNCDKQCEEQKKKALEIIEKLENRIMILETE